MTNTTPTKGTFAVSARVYDFFKNLAQIYLPAVGTLYFAIAGIYSIPGAEKVIGVITAVDVFLGIVLKISSVSYINSPLAVQGTIAASNTGDGNITFGKLSLDLTPEDVANKKSVTLNIVPSVTTTDTTPTQ